MKHIKNITIVTTLLFILFFCQVLGLDDKMIEYFSDEETKHCNLTQNETHVNILCDRIIGFSSVEKDSIDNQPICFSNIKSKNFSIDKNNLIDRESRKIIFAMNFKNGTEFKEIVINSTITSKNISDCAKIEWKFILSDLKKLSCYVKNISVNYSGCTKVIPEKSSSKKNNIQIPEQESLPKKTDYIEIKATIETIEKNTNEKTDENIEYNRNFSNIYENKLPEKKQNHYPIIISGIVILVIIAAFLFTRH